MANVVFSAMPTNRSLRLLSQDLYWQTGAPLYLKTAFFLCYLAELLLCKLLFRKEEIIQEFQKTTKKFSGIKLCCTCMIKTVTKKVGMRWAALAIGCREFMKRIQKNPVSHSNEWQNQVAQVFSCRLPSS